MIKRANFFKTSIVNVCKRLDVRIALGILGLFYACALMADWVAPYSYQDEDRRLAYAPPTRIHWVQEGKISWPYVYGVKEGFDEFHRRTFHEDLSQAYPVQLLHKGRLVGVDNPARLYFFGADSRGRDLLSRLIYGARISLTIGLVGSLISFAIGLIIGGISGYFGGWIDRILMRVCEAFMLVPGFYLMLALRAAVPPNFSSAQVYIMVVLILSLIGWASLARIIRGMSLSLRQRPYVDAARLLGLSHGQIIARHILPHTASYALVAISLTIPSYILAEAGLSLLGLGIQDPLPSWGNMMAESMAIVIIKSSPWILLPGVFILITVIAFNVLGEAFRDQLDPFFKHKAN